MEINYLINYIKINKAAGDNFRASCHYSAISPQYISSLFLGLALRLVGCRTQAVGLVSLGDRLLAKRSLRRKRYIVRHINIGRLTSVYVSCSANFMDLTRLFGYFL